jgi:hypothetical protein
MDLWFVLCAGDVETSETGTVERKVKASYEGRLTKASQEIKPSDLWQLHKMLNDCFAEVQRQYERERLADGTRSL